MLMKARPKLENMSLMIFNGPLCDCSKTVVVLRSSKLALTHSLTHTLTHALAHSLARSLNQSINQIINQSINQSINQAIN